MRLFATTALCAVVLVAAVARAGTPAECGAPAAMSDDWPVSPPAQQGVDPEALGGSRFTTCIVDAGRSRRHRLICCLSIA